MSRRIHLGWLFLFIFAVGALMPPASFARSELKKRRKELTDINTEIKQQEKVVSNLLKKEQSLLEKLDELDRNIQKGSNRISELRRDRDRLKASSAAKSIEVRINSSKVSAYKEQVSDRLRSLYKMGSLGYVRFLIGSEDNWAARQMHHAVRKVVSHDLELMDNYREQRDALAADKTSLDKTVQETNVVIEEIISEQAAIKTRRKRHKSLVSLIQNQRDFQKKALDELKQASIKLEKLVKKLSSSRRSSRFEITKGTLHLPVQGDIFGLFGSKRGQFKTQVVNQGIRIRAKKGTPFRAIYSGSVLYSGWFKGYGNILIIDHGGGYYSLSAHARKLFKKVNDRVRRDEIIGEVGSTGSLSGPHLYLELRNQGKTIDPLPWILPTERKIKSTKSTRGTS